MSGAIQEITKFEKRANLPPGFFFSLLEDSDWGLVIKLHSMFEGAATRVLNLRLGNGQIEDALSYLDFGNVRYGKAKLLRDLHIINRDQFKFLQKLSSIRNTLVHRIENVAFSFENYIRGLNQDQRKSFFNIIGFNTVDPVRIKDVSVSRNQFIEENPKLVLWLTASDVLASILVEEQFVDLEQKRRELERLEIAHSRKMSDIYSLITKAFNADDA